MCLLVVGCVNIYCDQDKLLLRGVEDLSDKDQLHHGDSPGLPPFSSCSLPFVARGIIAPSPLPPLPIVWLLGCSLWCFGGASQLPVSLTNTATLFLHSRLLDTIDTTLHISNIDDGRYTTP